MPQIRRWSRAEQDLAEVVRHIARDNATAALNWLDKIETLFRLLAIHSEIGERINTPRFGFVRRYTLGNYVVYYRPIFDGVEILRVLHGARDHDRLI